MIVESVMPGATRLMGYRALELRHYQQIIPRQLTLVVSVCLSNSINQEDSGLGCSAGREAFACTHL